MKMKQFSEENIIIPKKMFKSIITNFEHLLENFEKIVEQSEMKVIEKRLKDVKKGKVKGLTKRDFLKFLRKEGINA